MRAKLLKIVVIAAGLAVFSCMLVIRAQSIAGRPVAASITTNWVGDLVIGKDDPIDRIAPGNHPTTVEPVEIGLRSDGIVVWRRTNNVK